MKGFSLKRLTLDSVLAAVALIIFVLESRIPNLAPVPGMKLGLANIVTVWSMFALGPLDTLAILLVRIILGSVFAGSVTSFFFSLSGGMLCYLVHLFLRKILSPKQIFVAGIVGAIAHNIGQMIVALIAFQSVSVLVYLPFLMVSAVVTGTLTGLTAQFLLPLVEKARQAMKKDRAG
ncbi:MAG: Gx transporter family protein [Lachnospiraceae bacterium]|nr:Gx transporter family protein [Lachnospiraceae bacterium]